MLQKHCNFLILFQVYEFVFVIDFCTFCYNITFFKRILLVFVIYLFQIQGWDHKQNEMKQLLLETSLPERVK